MNFGRKLSREIDIFRRKSTWFSPYSEYVVVEGYLVEISRAWALVWSLWICLRLLYTTEHSYFHFCGYLLCFRGEVSKRVFASVSEHHAWYVCVQLFLFCRSCLPSILFTLLSSAYIIRQECSHSSHIIHHCCFYSASTTDTRSPSFSWFQSFHLSSHFIEYIILVHDDVFSYWSRNVLVRLLQLLIMHVFPKTLRSSSGFPG
jgi:hypothetical protein